MNINRLPRVLLRGSKEYAEVKVGNETRRQLWPLRQSWLGTRSVAPDQIGCDMVGDKDGSILAFLRAPGMLLG
jgi:hypothetical protein